MADRVSPAQRYRAQNIAEREVMRYAGDHLRWHKHVHNVDLDPMQVLKMEWMDRYAGTVDFSCRRTGKTATKELWCLEYNATHPDQEEGIVAPREAQAIVNMNYHLDSIRRSQILTAWLMYDRARRQFSDTRYQFSNRSKAQAYGIMAQVDGGDLTVASLEEVDDMPADRLYSRFLLMLGASRRLGASNSSKNDPIIRITGVYKGADTLSDLVQRGVYTVLPTVDVHLAIEMGIVKADFMKQMQDELPAEEYIRQLLCMNVRATNLIWEKWVRLALIRANRTGIKIEEPMPGLQRRKRGLVSFGYDHLGHGEDPGSSKGALVVLEQIFTFRVCIFCKTWKAGEDESVIRNDLVALWKYFQPDYAMGDAYGIGLIESTNDELYSRNLTTINRKAVGEGESTATTWKDWAFSPIRFEGGVKHQMAQGVRTAFKDDRAALPYTDDLGHTDTAVLDMRDLQRQLVNIAAVPTSKSYSSYVRVNKKIGDDLFDAYCAADHALNTAGTGEVSTIITHREQTMDELLAEGISLESMERAA